MYALPSELRRTAARAASRGARGPSAPRAFAGEARRWVGPLAGAALWLAALLLAAFAFGAATARAQDEPPADPGAGVTGPAGTVAGHFLASPEGDIGGALMADIWYPLEWFRIGGFFGAGAVPSEVDLRNRVFMPFGVSAGVDLMGDSVGLSLRVRGGLWGGATQEVKLTAGGFMGGGAYLLIPLGEGASVALGLDVWGVFGDGETVLIAPGAGLTWGPS